MSRKKSRKDLQRGAGGSEGLGPTATPDSRRLELLITLCAVIIALLHLYAAFFPSGVNWGFHHLGFLPEGYRVVIPLLMILVVLPPVRNAVVRHLESVVERFSALTQGRRRSALIAGIVLAATLFWFGRQATFFLGDGIFAQRSLMNIHGAEDIPHVLQNAPLPGFLTWKIYEYLLVQKVEMPQQIAFQIFSVIVGIVSIAVLYQLVKILIHDRVEQVLIYLFVLVGGSVQFFFGYVENYGPALLSLLLFAWLSLAYLKSKVHLVFPSLAFGLMFASHFGLFYLVPALLFLYVVAFRRGKAMHVLVSTGTMIMGTILLLKSCGYPLDTVKAIFLKEGGHHFVPIFGTSTGWHAYTMFSPWHLVDLANLYILLSPFAIIIFVVLSVVHRKSISMRNSQWIFLLLVSLFSLAFTIGFNFDIGMSRDWDLLVPYNFGLILAAAYCWTYFTGDQFVRRRTLVVIVTVTLLHSGAWVLLNSQEEPSIARFNVLRDERLWGAAAIIYANEDLGGYYRDRGEYARAIDYYRQGLAIDSTNGRRWLLIANAYQSMGQEANMIYALEKAAELGTMNAMLYGRLGMIYLQKQRIDDALETWKKGLSVDPYSAEIAYSIGATLVDQRRAYQEALPYLLRAAQINPNVPQVSYTTGVCYYHLGNTEEMKRYWSRFLQLAPNHPEAGRIRGLIGSTQ